MINDISELFWLLNLGIIKHNLDQITLGQIMGYPLYLLKPRTFDSSKPNVLIAAGVHGDEIAGPWGLVLALNFIEQFSNCNVSFLPLVSPTGFVNNCRYNIYGRSPNDGWIHEHIELLSSEGRLIKGHIAQILPLAKDGFLTLHEDLDHKQFYLYNMAKGDPDELVRRMLAVGQKYFGLVEDSFYYQKEESDTYKVHIQKGLVHNSHDGTFEDYLFHCGVPQTNCTETPQNDVLEKRIACVIDLIKVYTTR
jgi:hypothetical protein